MTDTQIVLQGFRQVARNFWPTIVAAIIGLAWLSIDERRGKDAVAKMEKTDKRNVA